MHVSYISLTRFYFVHISYVFTTIGIHGNDNSNVKIAAVEFRDFEVAAVALNNVDNLVSMIYCILYLFICCTFCHLPIMAYTILIFIQVITENTILGNRQEVPVTGMFSAARFIRPYGKYLKFMNYAVKDENGTVWKTAEQAYDALMTSINNVYEDVIYGQGVIDKVAHPREHHLFDNPLRVVDGPCYAFLVHGRGPAVGGMGELFNDMDPTVTSSNIEISNNIINNIKCWNNEVPALFGSCGHHGCIQNDPRGAVFQTVKTFDSYDPYLSIDAAGNYISNVVADMQLIVAQAILDGTLSDMPEQQIGPNSINQDLIDWARNGGQMTPQYVCNGDSMHHVIKGVVLIRVEDSEGFSVSSNIITNVANLSVKPFANCHDYHIGASNENTDEQQGGNIRAISVAATRGYTNQDSLIKNNYIGAISSANGNFVVGIDIQGDSEQVKVTLNKVDLLDSDNILTTTEEVVMDTKNTTESTVSALKQALRKDIKQTLEMTNLEEQQSLFDSQQESATDTIGTLFIALRVRELVGYVHDYNNMFLQPVQMLNVGTSTARKLWNAPHPRPPSMSGNVEWSYGGCPYHENYYGMATPQV